MDNIIHEISELIETAKASGRLLLFRNDDELGFLKEWIERNDDKAGEINPYETEETGDVLSNIIENCRKCGDIASRKHGWGTGKNSLMVILNTPVNISSVEINNSKKQSAEMLQNMLKAIKVDMKDCYITNLIKCETNGVSKTPGMMLKNCSSILIREIREYSPRIIIVMGDMLPLKNIIKEEKSVKWFSVDHPISLIKNTELKRNAWITLQMVMEEIR